ncbi:unnamed protein product [Didymodactylos carnosus]|uniref:Structure-specific endonuclease subunit SLX4 n=1 Tax=Didymodactylos carnosus TaxID=1234261 RepID=A0A815CJG9_9BILA|nr:unnamed protein product [Didymodactylos carnosus]CAF1285062.1 unnamed protein product [Didymodactylos carnosus]CAF3571982.1 unnamed protein product [Didymodactylos carnosus]CAF4084409.1 unnamed protein product [Didymodactylos carnosus]
MNDRVFMQHNCWTSINEDMSNSNSDSDKDNEIIEISVNFESDQSLNKKFCYSNEEIKLPLSSSTDSYELNNAVHELSANDSDLTDIYTPPRISNNEEDNNFNRNDINQPIKSVQRLSIKQNDTLYNQSVIILDDDTPLQKKNKSFLKLSHLQENEEATENTQLTENDHVWDNWYDNANDDLLFQWQQRPQQEEEKEDKESPLLISDKPQITIDSPKIVTQMITTVTTSSTSVTTKNLSTKTVTTSRNRAKKRSKKSMTQYRPPSPFSPKPDYKSLDLSEIKKLAERYGLLSSQSKTRLIKILNEIYDYTHQYETDTDYEWSRTDDPPIIDNKKALCHTPPTPAVNNLKPSKKLKGSQAIQRRPVHQMSSSDEDEYKQPKRARQQSQSSTSATNLLNKISSTTTDDADNENDSSENNHSNSSHEGKFLEQTVYQFSSSSSGSSKATSPEKRQIHDDEIKTSIQTINDVLSSLQDFEPPTTTTTITTSPQKLSSSPPSGITKTTSCTNLSGEKKKKTKAISQVDKEKQKANELELNLIKIFDYIKSNDELYQSILSYEPIDFEDFHKKLKTDLNIKIQSKDLMRFMDDQCLTFTLRKKGKSFTHVIRAKKRKH